MAMYVFKDKDRTKILLAKDSLSHDKDTRFYCPNKECDAHMYICNIEGVSSAYFRARRPHVHVVGCSFASKGFQPYSYDEESFRFEDALLSLTMSNKPQSKKENSGEHKEGIAKPKPIHTIRQIYNMCKAYHCKDKYNGIEIGQMLIDDRSAYMYPKGIFGWRVIESKYKYYNNDKKEINLVCPLNEEKLKLILSFDDEQLFKKIRKSFYENKEHSIVVAGEWRPSEKYNNFLTIILSEKQLAIIK